MTDEGENFTTFNSRTLVEMVGDVTDEALKATKIKDLVGILGGRFFNWAQRKSMFPLHLGIKCCALEMAAAGGPRFDAERFSAISVVVHGNVMFFLSMVQSLRNLPTQSFVFGSKCLSPSGVLLWVNVQFLAAHISNLIIFLRA